MPPDLIALRPTPLDITEIMSHITDLAAGGLALFAGTTRAETADLGPLVSLDYDCYQPMALAELIRIANTAREKFSITRLAILHRLGKVPVGEASVIIGVSTPHRAAAFEACRYLIDELKKTVPLWKHEHYEHGTRWQHPTPQANP